MQVKHARLPRMSLRCVSGTGRSSMIEKVTFLIDAADGAVVSDLSFIHPAGDNNVAKAAKVVGNAAKVREKFFFENYKKRAQGGYEFVPLAHQTFGRLGNQAMK